jgi:hypothetical protein
MDRRFASSPYASSDRRSGVDRRGRTERRSGSERRGAHYGDGPWNSYRFLAATFAAQILGQGNPSREKPAGTDAAYEPVFARLPLRPLFFDRSV